MAPKFRIHRRKWLLRAAQAGDVQLTGQLRVRYAGEYGIGVSEVDEYLNINLPDGKSSHDLARSRAHIFEKNKRIEAKKAEAEAKAQAEIKKVESKKSEKSGDVKKAAKKPTKKASKKPTRKPAKKSAKRAASKKRAKNR